MTIPMGLEWHGLQLLFPIKKTPPQGRGLEPMDSILNLLGLDVVRVGEVRTGGPACICCALHVIHFGLLISLDFLGFWFIDFDLFRWFDGFRGAVKTGS